MSGRIHRIVQEVERRKSPFAVSRLIMLTGVPVRDFDETSPDDPAALVKIEKALLQLFTNDELAELDLDLRGF